MTTQKIRADTQIEGDLGGAGFNDSEGDPSDVAGTAADGTSTYASRRDHVHKYIFLLPWGVFVNINPMSADGAPYAATLHKTVTFVKWSQAVYVDTTNNGTHYWKVKIMKSDGTTIKEINTSAISASTWTRLEATTFDVATAGTADVSLQVVTTKVGSPGALYVAGPILEVT